MHLGQAGISRRRNRPKLQVQYTHMSLLLGYLLNLLIDEILVMPIEERYKRGLLKALNKVIWVQNDLFARHYLAFANNMGGMGSEKSSDGGGSES